MSTHMTQMHTQAPSRRSSAGSPSFLLNSLFLLSSFIAVALSACGGTQGRANVKPAVMPDTGSFEGVWYSAQYGEMEIVQSGNRVVGTYVKNERSGKFQGYAVGDLLRFKWEEARSLVPGRPTESEGKGYFKYVIGKDEKHYLVGEWGYGKDEVGGGPWRAYKLRHKRVRVQGDNDPTQSSNKAVEEAISEDDASENESEGSTD